MSNKKIHILSQQLSTKKFTLHYKFTKTFRHSKVAHFCVFFSTAKWTPPSEIKSRSFSFSTPFCFSSSSKCPFQVARTVFYHHVEGN